MAQFSSLLFQMATLVLLVATKKHTHTHTHTLKQICADPENFSFEWMKKKQKGQR